MATLGSTREVVDALWPLIAKRIAERAASAVDLVDEMLHGFGRVRRSDQELRVGERVLNDDREILPRVARATSLGLSLYLGNRRVASFSVLEAGSAQEVGGYADASLVDTVLRKRETFRGGLEAYGHRYIIACRPLFASEARDDHGPLGMIEAFQDTAAYMELLEGTLRQRLGSAGQSVGEEQADRMEAVMFFIDDVARRLQLLALNGNIIAAQAGDHGRAFRVVCRELSSLADQSKEAVGEVRRLTDEMGFPAAGSPQGSLDAQALPAGPPEALDEPAPTEP